MVAMVTCEKVSKGYSADLDGVALDILFNSTISDGLSLFQSNLVYRLFTMCWLEKKTSLKGYPLE